jgi:hypothetical protein
MAAAAARDERPRRRARTLGEQPASVSSGCVFGQFYAEQKPNDWDLERRSAAHGQQPPAPEMCDTCAVTVANLSILGL